MTASPAGLAARRRPPSPRPYLAATTLSRAESTETAPRLQAIDVVRGLVMVLMAIDHVRVYAGQPPGGPTAGIFFTRWITHFAAPAFCFFAGTGAFLHGRKLGDVAALSRYLLGRGLLLVLLELTVIREAWTFNLDYAHYVQGNVIWVLGWCMVAMSALVFLSARTVGVVGLVIVFAQQLLRLPETLLSPAAFAATKPLWQLLYLGGKIPLGDGGASFAVIYAFVPWIGVMAAGYGFGALLGGTAEQRRRRCVHLGLALTAAYLVVAGTIVLAHAPQPGDPPLLFQLLGQQKYPASQLFLMMTLGPTIALLPLAERARGRVASMLTTFGRVPMFYYLLHIPLIHALAMIVSLVRTGHVDAWLFGNHPWAAGPPPAGYMWNLGLLYAIFAVAVALLYVPCVWYGRLKARHRTSLLRFI
ncbi:MAG: DUF1624 domain-containing protein [Gemmatirosa sp.]|nr:DUF1624 domain-containing protein [Gemmatirosa sp.]